MFCGPNREDCKAGYKCKIDPLDGYAVCCRKGKLVQHCLPWCGGIDTISRNRMDMFCFCLLLYYTSTTISCSQNGEISVIAVV